MILFYDVVPFNVFTLENEAQQQKNQIIIYMIQDMVHKPLVSFCYEDVCSVLPDKALEKSEVYISDIYLLRDGIDVHIFLGYNYAQQLGTAETSDFDIHLALQYNQQANATFQLVCMPSVKTSKTVPILKGMFNNYNYIEKTIIDQVHEHEDELQQLISQVRKITKYLSNEN